MRCIAHIDLDAFYCSVEHVRKNIPKDEPLGVQQWNHFIAVNYPARKFNIKRMALEDAKKLCPEIHCVHVDTIGEGKFKKAHLGPYRRASVRILEIIKRFTLNIERASIDEVYLDLTDQVKDITQLNSIDMDRIGTIYGNSDCDPLLLHGAMIVHEIRYLIETELGYTASAGLASSKVVAKLCSALNKPNKQTIVPESQILQFMSTVKISKIRMLGGQLKDELKKHYPAEMCSELWPTSLVELQKNCGAVEGKLIYELIRGIDKSEIVVRHEVKSHMAAKSEKFINRTEIESIVLLLCTELHERILDDYEEHSRWPNTITLSGLWQNPKQKSKSQNFIPFKQDLLVEDIYYKVIQLLDILEFINITLLPCFRVAIQLTNLVKSSNNTQSSFFNPNNTVVTNTTPINEKKRSLSVFAMLKKPKLETFYCNSCKKSFPLDEIENHVEHN